MIKTIIHRKYEHNASLGHLPPILQRIFSARSISSPDDLSRDLKDLLPYDSLLNIDKAIVRIAQALCAQERILIVGDFDADGATSTALAVSALRSFGALCVDYLIPNRFDYGYGLTTEIVEVARSLSPKLLITVDNGISSHAGVNYAKTLGIDVIITDHHLPGAELPDACAIVNPNLPNDSFPSKSMAGVGVIFYVMLALRSHLKKIGWFEKQNISCPNLAQFLDYVALGTVADVVSLDKNNRIMVHQGLCRIRAGNAHPGILALLKVAGRNREKLRSQDLGFTIGPRLNAAGRLEDMSLGVACLLSSEWDEAFEIAQRLNHLNQERRVIELKMQREAFLAVEQIDLKHLPYGVCLYQENWHQGVIGLVASRIKEKINRPVIAFAKVDANHLKGSARSITGLHIRDVLESIATEYPHMIPKFGGHAMAAGLSLLLDNYADFQKVFDKHVKKHIKEEDLKHILITDGKLSSNELSLETAELIIQAGPFGSGFPEPVFDGLFKLVNQRVVGQHHLKLILQIPDSEHYIDGIVFNVDLNVWPNYHCTTVRAVYSLDINEYKNKRKLQLLIDELIPLNEVNTLSTGEQRYECKV